MGKQFDQWNHQKKEVQKKYEIPYFYEREIWYISMGVNIGKEQDGKGELFLRPIVILKKFNKYGFYGIPLTSVEGKGGRYFFEIDGFEKGKRSFVCMSQIKAFDSKRLFEKKGMVKLEEFKILKEKIKELFK